MNQLCAYGHPLGRKAQRLIGISHTAPGQTAYCCDDSIFQVVGIAIGHEILLIHPSDTFGNTLNQWGARPEFWDISGGLRAAEDLGVTEVFVQLAKPFGRYSYQGLLGNVNDLCRYT